MASRRGLRCSMDWLEVMGFERKDGGLHHYLVFEVISSFTRRSGLPDETRVYGPG